MADGAGLVEEAPNTEPGVDDVEPNPKTDGAAELTAGLVPERKAEDPFSEYNFNSLEVIINGTVCLASQQLINWKGKKNIAT